ncbi:MAG: hypothetical protein IKP73_14320 [Bacteroidales bacterium]|nr:hypothetical protein [Bacteroidales bacterium]MBR4624751.1 hypothetical protein [Alphaproteobacteria bacterium]
MAGSLSKCYSSKYDIDEDKIEILVTNPRDDEETEPIEDAKKRMINALNMLTDYHPNPEIAKGTVVFMMTDTLYDDNAKAFDELVPYPHFGYIIANDNKSKTNTIVSKKKTKMQTHTESFQMKLKNGLIPIAISLLIISLIANVILLIWCRSTIKLEQEEKVLLQQSVDSLRTNGQILKEALTEANNKLAESSKPVSFYDETNLNKVELDINEFRKNGWFKSFVCHSENDSSVVKDTIIIRSNVDFVKGICYINIHKTSCETPPFIHVPFSLIGKTFKQEPEKKKDKGRGRRR